MEEFVYCIYVTVPFTTVEDQEALLDTLCPAIKDPNTDEIKETDYDFTVEIIKHNEDDISI